MPASTAAVIESPRRVGIRDRDDQPVRAGGDGGVDQLRHGHHVEGRRRLVLDLDAHVLGGLVDAVLHDRPERVGRLAVGDHDEAKRGAVRPILADAVAANPPRRSVRP